MGEICPQTKSCPPLIKQKLISTPPPHIMIILSPNPVVLNNPALIEKKGST